jgi:hypothetical protein
MSTTTNAIRTFSIKAASVLMLAMVAIGAWGQDTTTTTVKHGEASFDTKVKNAEVVYVEGNEMVLKLENGKLEHLVVPESDRFTIDGREVTVNELTPGTKLTQTITTTTAPRYVTSVRVLKGKIWHIARPRTVILKLPDNTTQRYTIPEHASFTIGGQKKTVFDLRKGMTVTATIITDEEHTVMEQTKSVVGEAPAPAIPHEIGILMVFQPRPAVEAPVELASAEEAVASTLPETGSLLPLAGLLGALALATSLGLGAARRSSVRG